MSSLIGDVRQHPVQHAVTAVREQLTEVAETPLWSLPDAEVAELLEQAHATFGQLADLTLRLTAEADRRGVAKAAGAPSTRAWLRQRLRMSPVAAKRQVLLAQRLATGCPTTRTALAAGAIDSDQAQVIARTVAELPADTDPDLAEQAEQRLVAEAATHDATVLARLAERILELVDPDGAEARLGAQLAAEEARYARRELAFTPDLAGMVNVRGRLHAEGAAMLQTALDPLAAPRPSDAEGPDVRSGGQRYADALIELCRRALGEGKLPSAGGEKPHLVITIDDEALRHRLGAGCVDTGHQLSAAAIRRLACDANLVPAVLGTAGVPLDLGRSVRLISGLLRRAVVLRDRGCAFPGCSRPPSWCDAHHIVHWVRGGPTSLDNAVLLCGHHHRLIHKGDWAVQLGRDKLPEFLPPEWIDLERRPLRNTMHPRT